MRHHLGLLWLDDVHVVAAIVEAEAVEEEGVCRNAIDEVVVVLRALLRPSSFSNGEQARKGEVLEVCRVGHVLAPERALHASVELRQCGGDVGWHGNRVVRLAKVVGAVASAAGLARQGALLAIYVVGSPGRIYIIESKVCCLLCGSIGARPAIYRHAGRLHEFRVGT